MWHDEYVSKKALTFAQTWNKLPNTCFAVPIDRHIFRGQITIATIVNSIAHDSWETPEPASSPVKNVWLVNARPRDIAKFKMAAISPSSETQGQLVGSIKSTRTNCPWVSEDAISPSFVYSSGKKISCCLYEWQMHIRIFLDFLLSFFTYSYVIRSLRCSRFGRFTGFNFLLFTITKDNNIFYETWKPGH